MEAYHRNGLVVPAVGGIRGRNPSLLDWGRHEGRLGRLPSGTGGEDPAGDPGCRAALSRAPEHMAWDAKQGTILRTERRFVSADSFLEGADVPRGKGSRANRPKTLL